MKVERRDDVEFCAFTSAKGGLTSRTITVSKV